MTRETMTREESDRTSAYSWGFSYSPDGNSVLDIEVHATPEGRITWCSHWEHIDALVKAGFVKAESLGSGTYGHIEYTLVL